MSRTYGLRQIHYQTCVYDAFILISKKVTTEYQKNVCCIENK
jgi:hypothetical protein